MKHGRLLVAAAAVMMFFSSTAVSVFADDLPYGAIASEKGNDNALGHATGYSTKEGAVAAAIAECNKYTDGKDDCTLRVWFHKQRCAAYVANAKEFDYYFGDSKADVVRKAHENFPDGEILDTACN